MPQIVEPKILDSRFLERILPSSIRKLPSNRLPLVGEAKHRMLANFRFQHAHGVSIQRHTSRCSILRLI